MKKLLGVLFAAILLVGCNATNDEQPKTGDEENVEKDQEQQALSMQVLKADEENGVTLEEEMYQELSGLVEANPDIGVADDFSIHGIDLVKTKQGESVMLFLGINKLEEGIKDITLEYTLGVETDGKVDYIFDSEEDKPARTICRCYSAKPCDSIYCSGYTEGEELLQLMTEENKTAKIENAKFELEK